MTSFLPKPSDSEPSFSRAIAIWRAETGGEAPPPKADPAPGEIAPARTRSFYLPYALALTLALGAGAVAASLATAPALDETAQVVAEAKTPDAKAPEAKPELSEDQQKLAALGRDMGSLKSEITRLQRALSQSRAAQAALSKSTSGQAAANQDEVKGLKTDLASLQKTLDATRGDAAAKIDGLNAKIEQSKDDGAKVAELRERLDRFEKLAQADREPAPKAVDADRETTGSISRAASAMPDRAVAQAQDVAKVQDGKAQNGKGADIKVVRNWTVRDVSRGVALLEGRNGMIEVVRGARAPGIGRVRSIERRDGQWVVVTDRGVVLERNEL